MVYTKIARGQPCRAPSTTAMQDSRAPKACACGTAHLAHVFSQSETFGPSVSWSETILSVLCVRFGYHVS